MELLCVVVHPIPLLHPFPRKECLISSCILMAPPPFPSALLFLCSRLWFRFPSFPPLETCSVSLFPFPSFLRRRLSRCEAAWEKEEMGFCCLMRRGRGRGGERGRRERKCFPDPLSVTIGYTKRASHPQTHTKKRLEK